MQVITIDAHIIATIRKEKEQTTWEPMPLYIELPLPENIKRRDNPLLQDQEEEERGKRRVIIIDLM